MCGITGIFAFSDRAPPVVLAELLACRDAMASRGPDGAGIWVSPDQRLGLGHRRLAIIDLADRARQPMHSADGRYSIVFNGEIYNHQDLRRDLEQRGRTFRTTSDTEVILELYAEHGLDMVPRLRGMFAFALYDARERTVTLARDPNGIKPLYYADTGGTLRFASQVKALIAGGAVGHSASAAGWTGFFLFGSVPDPHTTYADISSLPAGSTVVVSSTGAGPVRRYADIGRMVAEASHAAATSTASADDVHAEARAALRDSVRYHLVADVPVGAFLSGGIDSGALVGLMRDVGSGDLDTLTLSFREFVGRPEDEAPMAAEVARVYETRHTTRVVDEREYQDNLSSFFDAMDQPTIDGLNTWFVAKAAQERGLKVVVSGLGGDEIFGGYPSFRQIPRSVDWLRPLSRSPSVGRTLRRIMAAAEPARLGLSTKAASLFEFGGTYEGAYLLRRGLFLPWELDSVLPRETWMQGLAELAPLESIANVGAGAATGFARVSALELSFYMRNQLLRDTDWTTMAHSIEARVPLVDHVLLAKLASLPLDRPAFTGKALLLNAPSTALPTIVGERAKVGFVTPIETWMQRVASAPVATRDKREHWSRRWARVVERRFASSPTPGPSRAQVKMTGGALS